TRGRCRMGTKVPDFAPLNPGYLLFYQDDPEREITSCAVLDAASKWLCRRRSAAIPPNADACGREGPRDAGPAGHGAIACSDGGRFAMKNWLTIFGLACLGLSIGYAGAQQPQTRAELQASAARVAKRFGTSLEFETAWQKCSGEFYK